jgi:hypothetical protein
MNTYKTFLRSYKLDPAKPYITNNFLRGRKITQDTGLSYEAARQKCEDYNKNRNSRQIKKGTMLEFTAE